MLLTWPSGRLLDIVSKLSTI